MLQTQSVLCPKIHRVRAVLCSKAFISIGKHFRPHLSGPLPKNERRRTFQCSQKIWKKQSPFQLRSDCNCACSPKTFSSFSLSLPMINGFSLGTPINFNKVFLNFVLVSLWKLRGEELKSSFFSPVLLSTLPKGNEDQKKKRSGAFFS